jgi:hypothetical protein
MSHRLYKFYKAKAELEDSSTASIPGLIVTPHIMAKKISTKLKLRVGA